MNTYVHRMSDHSFSAIVSYICIMCDVLMCYTTDNREYLTKTQ